MTKKKITKKAVKKEKVVKVQVEQPKIEVAPETYKQDKAKIEVSKELPKDPEKKPVINPTDPKLVGIDDGFKKPSITNLEPAYTYKQYKSLMEAYEKQNPKKYRLKKSELETKLRRLK